LEAIWKQVLAKKLSVDSFSIHASALLMVDWLLPPRESAYPSARQ